MFATDLVCQKSRPQAEEAEDDTEEGPRDVAVLDSCKVIDCSLDFVFGVVVYFVSWVRGIKVITGRDKIPLPLVRNLQQN